MENDKGLTFLYTSSSGEVTRRELISWTEDDFFVRGIQKSDGGLRTFKKTKMNFVDPASPQWLAAEEPVTKSLINPTPKSESLPEIVFTGFAETERFELESIASASGMKVRKSVTENLSFLCAGENAGPKKIEKALAQGTRILNREQFINFAETGEIPDPESSDGRW